MCLRVALIPLHEFSDSTIMKKYGVNPDPETLDIANTAANQKQVLAYLASIMNLNKFLDYIFASKLNLRELCADCRGYEDLLG